MPVAAPNIAPLFPASEIAGLNSRCDTGRTEFQFCRGADKFLARPGRKRATVTEGFDIHIS